MISRATLAFQATRRQPVAMLLSQDLNHGQYIIQRVDEDGFVINETKYSTSVLLTETSLSNDALPPTFAEFDVSLCDHLASFEDAIVIVGTGPRLIFPEHSVLRHIKQLGQQFEFMDIRAACRTYNVLTSEGRRVVAALFNK